MAGSWRLAESLDTLRRQINEAYPRRNKASDGTIGDAAHAAGVSDHNPDKNGVVSALDITHDPEHGLDIAQLAETLRNSQDARIKYVIANKRVFVSPSWVWWPYSGDDPHENHLHISVNQSNYDDASEWRLRMKPTQKQAEEIVSWLYRLSRANGTAPEDREPTKTQALEHVPRVRDGGFDYVIALAKALDPGSNAVWSQNTAKGEFIKVTDLYVKKG